MEQSLSPESAQLKKQLKQQEEAQRRAAQASEEAAERRRRAEEEERKAKEEETRAAAEATQLREKLEARATKRAEAQHAEWSQKFDELRGRASLNVAGLRAQLHTAHAKATLLQEQVVGAEAELAEGGKLTPPILCLVKLFYKPIQHAVFYCIQSDAGNRVRVDADEDGNRG